MKKNKKDEHQQTIRPKKQKIFGIANRSSIGDRVLSGRRFRAGKCAQG